MIPGVGPATQRLILHERATVGPVVRIAAVGDIGLSGRVAAAAARSGGLARLFEGISPALAACDFAFGNLESSVSDSGARMFAGSAEAASELRRAGFSLLHLANNHVADYGAEGLASTLRAVSASGMVPLGAAETDAGARRVVRTDARGVRIAWLACGRTLVPQEAGPAHFWEYNELSLVDAVVAARGDVDVLIVSIHIGMMWLDYPRPEFQQFAARLAAAGADLVLAHHAHVLQGVQSFEGRLCCYNLGNCLFDWAEGNVFVPVVLKQQRESAVFFFDADAAGIAKATAVPIVVDDEMHVRWAEGPTAASILGRLAKLSRDMQGDFRGAFERQRAERNTGNIVRVLAFHARRGHWRYIVQAVRQARMEHLHMLVRWAFRRGALGRAEISD